jgi:hypothetical protein
MTICSRCSAKVLALVSVVLIAACDGHSSNDTPHPAQQPPTGWRIYGDAKLGFSIAYPAKWRVDRTHMYPAPVGDARIAGVAFIVPPELTLHTNLSTNSYLSVESAPATGTCGPSAFLETTDTQRDEYQDSLHWSVATAGDAGAGNLYDETIYVLKDSRPCLAIRYFIHSTNVENYTPGTVRQFDRAELVRLFDRIRSTFASSQSEHKS